MLQLEIPLDTVRAALMKAKAAGIRSILNLSPMTVEGAEVAGLADYVIMNMSEMTALTEASEKPAGGLEGLIKASSTGGQVYVVTKGKDGAIAVEPGAVYQMAAPDIVPVDTVGAGDTFAGYFAAGLDNGSDLKAALSRAVHAASLACLRMGAQEAIPFQGELASGVSAVRPG